MSKCECYVTDMSGNSHGLQVIVTKCPLCQAASKMLALLKEIEHSNDTLAYYNGEATCLFCGMPASGMIVNGWQPHKKDCRWAEVMALVEGREE